MAYIGVSPSNGVRQKHTYTATASQTTFSGAGSEGVSLSYRDSNYVDVYRNGVKLGDADYTATSGTSIVLGEGAAVSDIIEIVTYDVFSVADTVSKADGGTFDGNVAMAGTLAVTGETTLSTHLNMGDNDIIKLGDSADLQIYHDGASGASYIAETGASNLILLGTNFRVNNAANTQSMIVADDNGYVKLHYAGAGKFETTSTGIQVTGNIANASGDLTLDVAGDIILDADGGDINFKNGGTAHGNFLLSGTDFTIGSSQNNGDLIFRGIDGGADVTALTLDMSDAGTAIFNNRIRGAIASDGSPTYSFGTDSHTGMFSPGNDIIGFSIGGTERVRIDSAGHVTMPYQSAFSVSKSSTQTNIQVSSPVIVTFDTEIFDQNADFSSNIFTAPVTGRYQLNAHFYLLGLDTGSAYYEFQILTSNRGYAFDIDPNFTADVNYYHCTISVLADLDAGDTAYMRVLQGGGSQQTSISSASKFSGYLVA